MDYLGINSQTPEASEMDRENTESNFLGRENTDTTFATSANFGGMGQRTWSKPSLADSMSQALANVKQRQTQSPIAGQARGIVVRPAVGHCCLGTRAMFIQSTTIPMKVASPLWNTQYIHGMSARQEEQSLERRKSALKEAVQGTRPNLYQQIVREYVTRS